jgi:hypothetical protein
VLSSECIDWRLLLSRLCRGDNSCKDKGPGCGNGCNCPNKESCGNSPAGCCWWVELITVGEAQQLFLLTADCYVLTGDFCMQVHRPVCNMQACMMMVMLTMMMPPPGLQHSSMLLHALLLPCLQEWPAVQEGWRVPLSARSHMIWDAQQSQG